jgi:uncharacterized iron-regulated protein
MGSFCLILLVANFTFLNLKNQGECMCLKMNGKRKTYSFISHPMMALILASFLWGCAGKADKVMIRDTSATIAQGTIISAKTGGPVAFDELMKDLNRSQIVFVGETHTNGSHHGIQLKIIQDIFKNNPSMRVGMEMFDRSYQEVLELWSAGVLDEDAFLRKVHWYANWRFDFALYRDILLFIKQNRIKLVALNIPTYIPARIRVGGLENLSDLDRQYLPKEIDTSNSAHRDYAKMVFELHNFKGQVKFDDFYMAQCIWDEIMAESVASNLGTKQIVVLAGNGHIQFKYGVPDRAFRRTGVPFRTIYLASAGEEVELGVADYIWITPAN